MLRKLCFKLLTRKTFSIEGEDLPSILQTLMIFPFELYQKMTFSLLVLVMLENKESSPIMSFLIIPQYSLSHSLNSLDSYT